MAGVRFDELTVETRNGTRRACVVTPERDIVLSRNRLQLLRAGQTEGALDAPIIEHLAQGQYNALVFRGTNDDATARYGLSDELDDAERLEAVSLLLRAHLRFFRAIERHGVVAFLGVGFTDRDAADYERAADQVALGLAASLKGASVDEAIEIRTDQWLLERQATWSAAPYELFVETKLAAALVAAERQHRSFIRLAGRA